MPGSRVARLMSVCAVARSETVYGHTGGDVPFLPLLCIDNRPLDRAYSYE